MLYYNAMYVTSPRKGVLDVSYGIYHVINLMWAFINVCVRRLCNASLNYVTKYFVRMPVCAQRTYIMYATHITTTTLCSINISEIYNTDMQIPAAIHIRTYTRCFQRTPY